MHIASVSIHNKNKISGDSSVVIFNYHNIIKIINIKILIKTLSQY